MNSYPHQRWYRLISTVLQGFSFISTMPKLYKASQSIFTLFELWQKENKTGNRQRQRKKRRGEKETIILKKSSKKTRLLRNSKLEKVLYVKKNESLQATWEISSQMTE